MIWTYLIAVSLATLRIGGMTHPAFQAAAHLFVGGLFAASYVQFFAIETESQSARLAPVSGHNFAIAIVLSLIELFTFIVQKVL